MQFGQSACMFHISYGLQWRQGRRYIADSNASALSAENDRITSFAGPLIYTSLLEVSKVLELQNQFHFRGTLTKPLSLSEGNFCHILSATITINAKISPKRVQIGRKRTNFAPRFPETCISPTAKILPPVRLYSQVKIKLDEIVDPLRYNKY